jgi:hypothetical protein
MRLDFYVGERDTYGVGFSDNVIFRKQYYLRAILDGPLVLYRHEDEKFMSPAFVPQAGDPLPETDSGWTFAVSGSGFEGKFAIELDHVPLDGAPIPLRKFLESAAAGAPGATTSAMPRPPGTSTPGA